MKLYGADVCPFVHRVRLVLAEKGLKHEYVAIDLANKPEWYHEVLPSGKVPLLEHDGFRIWESAIVCEYLDEAFPEKQMMPSEPGARAEARLWFDWIGNSLVGPFYDLLKAETDEDRQTHRATLTKALEKLENEGFQESEFIYQKGLGLVDLMVYPWFERWIVLEHYRGMEVPKALSKLTRWRALMKERSSVRSIAQADQLYIDQYRHYAEAKVAR